MKFWSPLVQSLILCLLQPCFASGFPDPVVIVTLGDSITKGYRPGVARDETFSALLEKSLGAKGARVRVVNMGIGGERTDQALIRFDKEVVSLKPAVVTIMYGANDSYIDRGGDQPRIDKKQFGSNLRELIHRCEKMGARPILMTSNCYGTKPNPNGAGQNPNDLLRDYMEVMRGVSKETGVILIDHFDFWTRSSRKGIDVGNWTTDQLHPNPIGHQKMSDLMVDTIYKTISNPE